jgi:hypothetical protein
MVTRLCGFGPDSLSWGKFYCFLLRESEMIWLKSLVVVLCGACSLGFAWDLSIPIDKPSCVEGTCQNLWFASGGSTTFNCGTACGGTCAYCEGNVVTNYCTYDIPGTGCVRSSGTFNCGWKWTTHCSNIGPGMGCSCTQTLVPGNQPTDCLIIRCNST